MTIDFDEIIDRNSVDTLKFDAKTIHNIFGSSKLWQAWVADMDFKAAPAVIDALSTRLNHGVYGYAAGTDDLPMAVASWFKRRYNWSFPPQHIIDTPRTLNSLAVLIKLFSNEGDGVIIQPPVFYDFKLILRANKRKLIKNPLQLTQNKYEFDFEQLESVAADKNNKLLILCNPHNPVGRVWSKEELTKISKICLKHKVFIISDEIHGDITYQHRYTPLATISKEAANNCASCISPAKSFNLAGVAHSMIVINDESKRQTCADWYNKMQLNKNNVFSQAAMLGAYTKSETWLEQAIEYLQANIKFISDFLAQNLPQISLIEPEGTYLVWLDFRALGFEPKQLESFLVKQALIASNPGHWFGREGAGFVRLNIACPRKVLKKALLQLKVAIDNHI